MKKKLNLLCAMIFAVLLLSLSENIYSMVWGAIEGGKAGMERRFAGTRSGGTASGSAGTSKRINAAAGLAGGGSAYRCVFAKSDGTVHPAGNAAVGQAPEPANCHV